VIPRADIVAWRQVAPWADDAMVEQDLVLSRALVDVFSEAPLARAVALRGGTALHKLMLDSPGRYS
jgi:predicted nucleotidyltransferase component of viral defense system